MGSIGVFILLMCFKGDRPTERQLATWMACKGMPQERLDRMVADSMETGYTSGFIILFLSSHVEHSVT